MRFRAKWYFRFILLPLVLATCMVPSARAQFIGYVSLQTVTSTPFASNTPCTGTEQISGPIQNLGQVAHQANLAGSSIFSLQFKIIASNDNITFFDISDQATAAGPNNTATVTGTGYYSVIKVSVTCASGGVFGVKYSGTNGTTGPLLGDAFSSQYTKNLTFLAPANANFNSSAFRLPTANTAGTIFFNYNVAAVAGSSITITCSTNNQMNPSYVAVTQAVANILTTLQAVPIPGNSCPYAVITYNSGGATAGNYSLSYALNVPGTGLTSGSGANVNVAQYGGVATSLGQKAMAASMPVVIASDQSAIPVTFGAGAGTGIVQPSALKNSETTSAANSTLTVSIAAVGGQRVQLYGLNVRCSAGTASVTVKDGVAGTVIWSTDSGFVSTSSTSIAWTSAPLATTTSNGMDVVVSSCGPGNSSTLDVQASQL